MFDTIEDKQVPCFLNKCICDRYLLEKRLGSGGYSVVYLAVDLESPCRQNVAVKCLLGNTSARKIKTCREIALHHRASAISGVAKIFRAVEEGGFFFIILEYCPDGDLFSAISETRIFLGRDNLIKTNFLQLMDTVISLHKIGIYHRDLKPENVLCTMNGTKLLLTDFGLATEFEKSTNFGCGSYFYMTPECLAGFYTSAITGYSSRAADIWALGIILVNMICSRSPWKAAMLSDPSFARYVRNHQWLRQMLPLSKSAFYFLNLIFANHGNNIALADLRTQFLQIDTFYMSGAELACADKTVRLVAREWMPESPVDDIKQEDLRKMTKIDDINEAQLFEDGIPDKESGNSTTVEGHKTVSPLTAMALSLDNTLPLSSMEQSIVDNRLGLISPSSSIGSGSESDFPITPETRPADGTESVPDLPDEQCLGERLDLSAKSHQRYDKDLVAIDYEIREYVIV